MQDWKGSEYFLQPLRNSLFNNLLNLCYDLYNELDNGFCFLASNGLQIINVVDGNSVDMVYIELSMQFMYVTILCILLMEQRHCIVWWLTLCVGIYIQELSRVCGPRVSSWINAVTSSQDSRQAKWATGLQVRQQGELQDRKNRWSKHRWERQEASLDTAQEEMRGDQSQRGHFNMATSGRVSSAHNGRIVFLFILYFCFINMF